MLHAFDGRTFGDELVAMFVTHIDAVTRPLIERNLALESRLAALEKADEDRRVETAPARIREMVQLGVSQGIAAFDKQFKDHEAPIAGLETRVAALETREPIIGEKGEPGVNGRDGIDGKDAPAPTLEQIENAVAEYFAGNPPPAGKDGRDGIDGKDGTPGLQGEPGRPGEAGAKGMDGRNGRDGVGLPGRDGKDGTPGLQGEPGRPGEAGAKGMDGRDGRDGVGLPGRDGKDGLPGINGKDGLDGLGFDDLEIVHDGERTVTFRYVKGEKVKETAIVFPIPIDRGVFKDGNQYQKGDAVSFGGSAFIAQRDTSDKPETSDAWRLAVKRGRDGALGKPHEPRKVEPVRA